MSDNVDDQVEGQGNDNLEDEIEVVHEEDVQQDDGPDQEYAVFEDTVEPVQEEAVAEEGVEEEKPKQKKHKTLKTEFNKVQREKYQALHEIDMLRVENERLQKLAALSTESATYHNDKSIELKLEQARRAKVSAYENADTEGMLKADELFAEAMNAKAESDRWKTQQRYNQEQQSIRQKQEQVQQQYNQEPEPYSSEESDAWVSNNPWCDPDSGEYNQDIAQDVLEYSKIIDRKYARQGKEDLILSQQYFDEIDRYVAENYGDNDEEASEPVRRVAARTPTRAPQTRTNINMKQVRQNVAPVGKTIKQAAPTSSNRVVLSARERDFAKTMGISEKEYARQKLDIDKSGRYGYESNKR